MDVALQPGMQLDRFRILGLLGQGGMGHVYRAHDPQLGREVAIKLSLEALVGTRLQRFQREAQVAAQLVHPGIVRLHETGIALGKHYLVYELVPGARTLDQVLRERDLRGRVELVRDAALALGYAHAQGVIHRDVKPDNLLVGSDGALRVADFGLAAGDHLEQLTRTGAWVGTPHYMAPEQVNAQRGEQGPPTDVWALGVVLYQAIAGGLPFAGQGMTELAAQIAGAAPQPLPAEAGALRAVCRRVLAKEPADRYPHAGALAADLEAWLEGRLAPPARGSRLAAVGLVLALAVGLGAHAWRTPTTPPPAAPPQPNATPPRASDPAQEAHRAWEAVRAIGNAQQRLEAVHAWLTAHPDEPLPARDRDGVQHLAQRYPLFQHELAPGCAVAVAWDGETLVAASQGVLERRDPGGSLREHREVAFRSGLTELALVPSGVAALEVGNQVHLLRGDQLESASSSAGNRCLAASPDGRWLAVGKRAKHGVWVYRLPELEVAQRLPADEVTVTGLAFTPDGRYLVAGEGTSTDIHIDSSGRVQVWDTASWTCVASEPYSTYPDAMNLGPEGQRVVLGGFTGQVTVHAFPPTTGFPATLELEREVPNAADEWRRATAHQGWVSQVVVSPDGRRLYSTAGAARPEWNDLLAWELPSGRFLWRRALPGKTCDLDLSPDGRYLAFGFEEGLLEVQLVLPD